jgi:hypothetical protein
MPDEHIHALMEVLPSIRGLKILSLKGMPAMHMVSCCLWEHCSFSSSVIGHILPSPYLLMKSNLARIFSGFTFTVNGASVLGTALQGMRQLEDLSIESKKLEKKVLVIFP